jgi:hypothetical protein
MQSLRHIIDCGVGRGTRDAGLVLNCPVDCWQLWGANQQPELKAIPNVRPKAIALPCPLAKHSAAVRRQGGVKILDLRSVSAVP